MEGAIAQGVDPVSQLALVSEEASLKHQKKAKATSSIAKAGGDVQHRLMWRI